MVGVRIIEAAPVPERSVRRTTAAVGLLVVALLSVATGARSAWSLAAEGDGPRRAEVLEVAESFAAALVNVAPDTVADDLEQVRRHSTGDVADRIAANATTQTQLIQEIQGGAEGSVTAAGVQSVDGDEAVVLVAVRAQQTSGETSQEVGYRMRLALDLVSGEWKVSDVEFVE